MPPKKRQRYTAPFSRALIARERRASETPEQRQKRLESDKIRKRIARASKIPVQNVSENRTAPEDFKILEKHKRKSRKARACKTLTKEAEIARRKRALETPEQRKKRLEKDKIRKRNARASETPEERETRLLAERIRRKEYYRRKMEELRRETTFERLVSEKSKETIKKSARIKDVRSRAKKPSNIMLETENNEKVSSLCFKIVNVRSHRKQLKPLKYVVPLEPEIILEIEE